MYLNQSNQKPAGDFLNGVLWQDMKRCLLARRPDAAEVKDESHVAAAKGHKRAGYEAALAELEKLPFEHDEKTPDPFQRPAIAFTED